MRPRIGSSLPSVAHGPRRGCKTVPRSSGMASTTSIHFTEALVSLLFHPVTWSPSAQLCRSSLIGRLRSSTFRPSTNSSVDVTHGLALLFGLGTKALPSWDSRTRWNNLMGDLAVSVTAGSNRHTNSLHPSSREGHHSTVGWISGFLLSDLILYSCHAAATSLVHRNSVPSTQMRCMITASRRASATIAFFIPRCLAIFIAQALGQDHFAERTSMIWAAS